MRFKRLITGKLTTNVYVTSWCCGQHLNYINWMLKLCSEEHLLRGHYGHITKATLPIMNYSSSG